MDSLLGDGQYHTILNKAPTRWTKALTDEVLINRLQLQTNEDNYFRDAFICITGLTPVDLMMKGDIFGPLDELKASNFLKGPFTITLTNKPSEHLMFFGSHRNSTLRLLDLKTIFQLYVPQRVGIARYIPEYKQILTLYQSCRLTNSLLGINVLTHPLLCPRQALPNVRLI
jgi:hypothetical protein